MATVKQLVQQIRFGLETLGERNAHHDFESLCLGLARRRITSNLLPATGPVSAGGDQARDAESHWTNLQNEIPGTSLFVSRTSADTVVVACTIQRDNVPTKIRSDIATICESGSTVRRVIYFTVAPVVISKRHELQEEAQRDHQVTLDIWDGLSIATHLADSDLFFLAVQHLDIPSELAPPPPDSEDALPAWYIEDRNRWRARTEAASSFGELLDLRGPLRYATFRAEAREDLADWLSYARAMLTATCSRNTDIALRVRYEIAVATLRGTKTLRPADELVRTFFATLLQEVTHPGLLEDAIVLGTYCQGAFTRNITDLTYDELTTWHIQLHAKVRRLLTEWPLPNREANLLALSARLALHPQLAADMTINTDELAMPTEVTEETLEALNTDESAQVDLTGVQLIDLDGGMADLELLCERIPNAPVFPVDNITKYFDFLSPLLANHRSYRKVRDALDDATERVTGEAAKADRSRRRAIQFLHADRLLDALSEIHDAKVNWWHGDTLRGALLAMLLAAEIYSRLRLPLAAKQYALTVVLMASSSREPELANFVPRGVILAASYDYQAGNWLTATGTFEAGLYAQGALVNEPWDIESHDYLADMLSYQARIAQAARDVRPQYSEFINAIVTRTEIDAIIEPLLADLPEYNEESWTRSVDDEGMGRPFSDAGSIRTYTWAALGINWTLAAENERSTVLAAERFVAATQIVLAELAPKDALLLRGKIHITVQLRDDSSQSGADSCEMVPDNEASRWIVHLVKHEPNNINHFHSDLTSALIYVLMTNSLLPRAQFLDIIDQAFERGLFHKLAIGRPYDEAADLLKPDLHQGMSRLEGGAIGMEIPIAPSPVPELAASSKPGPGYDREEALVTVRRRYENMLPVVQYTLPRLVADLQFRSTITRLRSEGWLDWHILTAIANYVGNSRLRWEVLPFPPESSAEAERIDTVMRRPENATDPRQLPEAFSESTLRLWLQTAMLSTVRGLGLECHQQTPDFAAISELLGARYGYWTDDVPHDNFFLWPEE